MTTTSHSKQRDVFSKSEVIVGGMVPRLLSEHLSLLALYHGKSRSKYLKELIKSHVGIHPTDKLISGLAERAYKDWKDSNNQDFSDYIIRAEISLKRKKIAKEYITAIVEGMHAYYAKDSHEPTDKETRKSDNGRRKRKYNKKSNQHRVNSS